jgi:hypothetical protein
MSVNEKVKIGIGVAAGLCIGGGIGYIIAERKVRKEAEADLAAVRAMFRRLREEDEATESESVQQEARDPERWRTDLDLGQEALEDQVRELGYDTAVSNGGVRIDPNYIPPESQPLGDEAFDEDVEEDLTSEVDYMRRIRIINPNRDIQDPDDVTQWDRSPDFPYIITEAEFRVDEPNFEKLSLTYYRGDESLAEANDDYIPDVDGTAGLLNLRDHWGAGSDDPNTMYIRNERINADFEITLNEGSYVNAVAGFTIEDRMARDSKKQLRKMRPE